MNTEGNHEKALVLTKNTKETLGLWRHDGELYKVQLSWLREVGEPRGHTTLRGHIVSGASEAWNV